MKGKPKKEVFAIEKSSCPTLVSHPFPGNGYYSTVAGMAA